MKRNSLTRWSTAMLTTAALSGCGMFHHHTDYYSKAAESRPLEVPPDLDSPPAANELSVPATGTGAGVSSNVSSVPPAAGGSISESDLFVADSREHTWTRVGLALDRAQVGTISARDEAGSSYTVDFNSTIQTVSPAPEHHWYTRVIHPFGGGGSETTSRQVKSQLTVRVKSEKDGARVTVEGAASDKSAPDAARRIVSVLRERLS